MHPPQGRTAWEIAAVLDVILGKDTPRARWWLEQKRKREAER